MNVAGGIVTGINALKKRGCAALLEWTALRPARHIGNGEQRGSELTIDTPNASKSLSFRNQSIEDSSNLPDPGLIAREIVEDLEAALQQFAAIAADLKSE